MMTFWQWVVDCFTGPHFWATVALVAGSIWVLALFLSYYFFSPQIWIERYRKVSGLDHTGFFLELLFCVGLTYTCYRIAVFSYPEAGDAMRAGGWFTWTTIILLGLAMIVVVVQNIHTSRSELPKEIQESHPELYQQFEANWEEQVKGLQWQYLYYVWASLAGWWLLIVAVLLFFHGSLHDLSRLVDQNTALGDFAPVATGGLDETKIMASEQSVLAFTEFRETLLRVVNKALIPLGLFMLLFYLFLGTRYQDLYAPSTRDYYRYFACFFMLICLPVLLGFGYYQLVSAAEVVNNQFEAVAQSALATPPTPHTGTFNDLREKLTERASVGGFLLRMASSWGGILVLFQFVLSGIGKRAFRWSLFQNLIPRSLGWATERTRALFSNPDDLNRSAETTL